MGYISIEQEEHSIETAEILVSKDFESKHNNRGFRGCVNLSTITVSTSQYLVHYLYTLCQKKLGIN